jgi:hypothetical protein
MDSLWLRRSTALARRLVQTQFSHKFWADDRSFGHFLITGLGLINLQTPYLPEAAFGAFDGHIGIGTLYFSAKCSVSL